MPELELAEHCRKICYYCCCVEQNLKPIAAYRYRRPVSTKSMIMVCCTLEKYSKKN